MLTYEKAEKLLNGVGIQNLSKKLNILRIENNVIGINLYNTIILTINEKNECRYYAGDFRTATTKKWINHFGPVPIKNKKGNWFVNDQHFFDGIMVNEMLPTIDNFPKDEQKNSLIDQYVEEYANYVQKHGMFVSINDWSVATLGESLRLGHNDCPVCFNANSHLDIPKEHIENHMKLQEFVPSLLYKAFSCSQDPALLWVHYATEMKSKKSTQYLKNFLKSFLKSKMEE